MLTHQPSVANDNAASRAADDAHAKFEALLAEGRRKAAVVLDEIDTKQPFDRIVRARALDFRPTDDHTGIEVQIASGNGPVTQPFTRFAMSQLCARAGVPKNFADDLLDPARREWGAPLLANVMGEMYHHDTASFLVRSVNNRVAGFLSDRYRRLDSRPIVGAFVRSAQEVGAMPLRAFVSETRVSISMVLDRIFQPIEGGLEMMLIGATLINSDFGAGPLEVSFFAERLVCLNGLIAAQQLRQVHLGVRLGDDIEYSQRTYQLDTATQASAVRDLVRGLLNPSAIETFQERIRRAAGTQLTPQRIGEFLGKALSKAEKQTVVDSFNSPDVIELPPGQNAWRLAQTLGLAARDATDDDKRIELQRLAGSAMLLAA